MKKRNCIFHSNMVFAVAIFISLLFSAGPAFGQFIVQPMTLNVQTRPRKLIKTAVDIQSLDPNEVHTIDFSLAELSQNEDSTWRIIEPNSLNDPNSLNYNFDLSTLSSCKDWITLGRDSMDIGPHGRVPLPLTIRVPSGTRGFYAAGIIALLRTRPDATGITVLLRMLVPVIVEVQGRTIRHRVEFTDVGLEFIDARAGEPATSIVSLDIENNGGTYSRLHPFARVWNFSGDHWRLLTTMEFKEVGIIPGSKLKLKQSMEQSLPSGKYKVTGALYVDAQRAKELKKEIDFVGDPRAKKAASDAPVDFFPPDVIINCLPGVTRMGKVTIFNASDEAINVQTGLELPSMLDGTAFVDFKGDDLDCSNWLKINPEKFTLRSNGQQNLNIIAEMPENIPMHPSFYTLLSLQSSYADGQNAGKASTNICAVNENIEAQPVVTAMKLTVAHMEGARYLVVARFGNFGKIHFTPIACRAVPIATTGASLQRIWLGSEKRGPMLPLEIRDFSGILDVSYFPAGTYYLVTGLEYAPGERATTQIGIRVSIQGDQRLVDIVRLEEELEEKIKVRW